jgi:hypothetical protein
LSATLTCKLTGWPAVTLKPPSSEVIRVTKDEGAQLAALTVNVTCTLATSPVSNKTVMCPLNTPGPNEAPFTMTVNVAGVFPLLGLTDNQKSSPCVIENA